MNNSQDYGTQVYRIPVKSQYKRRRRPKKHNNFPKFLLVLAMLVGCVFYFVNNKINVEPVSKTNHSSLDFTFNFSPRTQNILLMGVDVATNKENVFKGNRSDTMLLISIAPYGKNVNVISIPRDSKVYLAGRNKADKINHAFAFGGAKLAVRTVEETFGVKIHHYLAISNAGVIKAIDILGGLPIYIEKNMRYDDYTAKLHINLKKGNHVLTGKQVEGYLRFRHDSFGDIGRIRRQQWFFNAIFEHIKNPMTIVKLPELLKVLPDYIQTDLSAYDLTKYAGMLKGLDISTVQIATIPGSPSTKGIISYWIIEPLKAQELINKMVYRNKNDIKAEDIHVGILYADNQEENAKNLQVKLEEKGMKVKIQPSDSITKTYVAVHNLDVAGDVINNIKKLIPEIEDKHTIYDPIGINRFGKDFTIVISDN